MGSSPCAPAGYVRSARRAVPPLGGLPTPVSVGSLRRVRSAPQRANAGVPAPLLLGKRFSFSPPPTLSNRRTFGFVQPSGSRVRFMRCAAPTSSTAGVNVNQIPHSLYIRSASATGLLPLCARECPPVCACVRECPPVSVCVRLRAPVSACVRACAPVCVRVRLCAPVPK